MRLKYMNNPFLTLSVVIFFLCAPWSVSTPWADDPEARSIMEKVDARYDGDDRSSTMKMILTDKHGKRRIRNLKTYSLDRGDDTLKLSFFLSPVDVKDTGFLNYDYGGKTDDDQWLYLPALHKTKRIASDDKTSSFMGSDYSYADMTDRELENYDYRLIKETEVRGNSCWVIESLPRTQKVIDDFGYTRSILFVRQDCHVAVRAVHWVKEGAKLKYMDIKKMKKIDGIQTPVELHMTTKKGKKKEHGTILVHSDIRYNKGLPENMFTVRQLEKGVE